MQEMIVQCSDELRDMVLSDFPYLSVIDTRDKGLAPFGKQSTNLMSNTLRALYNGTQQTITYTYLYDNLGRVSRQTQVQRNVGSSSFVTTICNYTYY